jgi:hypothetical protein
MLMRGGEEGLNDDWRRANVKAKRIGINIEVRAKVSDRKGKSMRVVSEQGENGGYV